MRRLVLLRHGRTEWNDTGRAQGHADVPLDETGEAQAKAVAPVLAALSPVAVWSSDLARAAGTAAVLAAETGLEPVLDPRLREFDIGPHRVGLTDEQYAAAHPEEHAALVAGDVAAIPGRETPRRRGGALPARPDVVRRRRWGRARPASSSPTAPPCAWWSPPSSSGATTSASPSGC